MKTIFLDIGGVILTNGWDHSQRLDAAEKFHIDWNEFSKRHTLYYPEHEEGRISLSTYLQKTVFYEKRTFTEDEFVNYMKSLSRPFEEMLVLFKDIHKQRKARIMFLSNEGKELAEWRISTYNLTDIGDCFVISSFVGYRKPSQEIYKLALDLSQAKKKDLLYIDDRKNLIDTAEALGIPSFQHTQIEETKKQLNRFL